MPHGEYKKRADYKVIAEVLRRVKTGFWGSLDPRALFATGISSGGYHTSRLGLSFPRTFRALAIQSASYATCLGPLCQVPDSVPSYHPATLFLHGARDLTVPLHTARKYYEVLSAQGIETDFIVNKMMGHAWIDEAPQAITAWFVRYLR
jgi:predicted esterase